MGLLRKQGEAMNTKSLLERLYVAANARTDKELSEMVEKSPQAIYEAKKKNRIPDSWVRIVAEKTGVSADWIFFERGPFKTTSDENERRDDNDLIDKKILIRAITEIEEASDIIQKSINPANRAEITLKVYNILKKDKEIKDLFDIIEILKG